MLVVAGKTGVDDATDAFREGAHVIKAIFRARRHADVNSGRARSFAKIRRADVVQNFMKRQRDLDDMFERILVVGIEVDDKKIRLFEMRHT